MAPFDPSDLEFLRHLLEGDPETIKRWAAMVWEETPREIYTSANPVEHKKPAT